MRLGAVFRLALEAVVLTLLAVGVGLIANAYSPFGIPLTYEGEPPWVPKGVRMLTLEEGVALYNQGAVFVDARPQHEYEEGHVAGAIHLDVETEVYLIPERLGHVPSDFPIVAYCDSFECGLSTHLADELQKFGYTNITVFKPGWSAWIKANLPTEQGPGPTPF